MEKIGYTSALMTTLSPPLLTAVEDDTSSGWMHFHKPYVRPTVFCHRRRVPSSLPLAYSSPSGENRTQCTGPKWPLNDSAHKQVHASCNETQSDVPTNPTSNLIDVYANCWLSLKVHTAICTRIHTPRFNGHFPGKPGLAGSPLNSQSPVILILSILTGQA